MFIANYEYSEIIGQGAFGLVYKGRNMKTGEPVVVKTEPQSIQFSSLKHETNILNILYSKSCRNIPPTYWYGTTSIPKHYRVLVMPFYEESLIDIQTNVNIQTISNIMRSAITIIHHIHDNYVVHRDMKPANFMIHNNELVLIDFGLASFYVDSNGRHIPCAVPKKTSIVGTPKYVSWNVHCGEEYSRRDDLLSIVYIGLFLIYGDGLWSNIPAFQSEYEKSCIFHPRNQWFKRQKELSYILPLIAGKWDEFAYFTEKVYGLSFQERPSYKEYIELFSKTI
jgi:serine/threonine protein kinase